MCINLLTMFLNFSKAIEVRSERTCQEYEIYIRHFLKYSRDSSSKDKRINEIDNNFILSRTKMDLYNYLVYCKEKGNSESCRATKISAIKIFYEFLVKENFLKENPFKDIKRPKIPKRSAKSLTLKEAKFLIEAVKRNKKSFYRERNYCILITFLTLGLRLSELENLKIEDIREDYVTIIGKGNKERIIPIPEYTKKVIEEWLKNRGQKNKYIFTTKSGDKCSKSTISSMIKRTIKEAGLSSAYSTHSLRHSCASFMYNYGTGDLKSIQEILGHSDISTTERYVHINLKEIAATINSNPLLAKKESEKEDEK